MAVAVLVLMQEVHMVVLQTGLQILEAELEGYGCTEETTVEAVALE
jgi:hypothetical protein